MGKRKGRSVKNAEKKMGKDETDEVAKAPHTFVIFRGKIGKNVRELMKNVRHVMEPYTASNLKIRKGNVIKDYVSVAGLLNVSHLLVFSKSEIGIYLRIIRLPHGPTLTFKINHYSLTKDVMSSIKRHVNYAAQFAHHPLLVLNDFNSEEKHLKLLSSMLQNMFPALNVNSVKLNSIRRCVLFNYNPESKTIDFRHYTIKVVPTGLSRSVKKLVQSKVPDLGKYEDISEYIMKSGNLSESEAEQDGPENNVTLSQNVGSRGNIASHQSAIRLIELGPRLSLQLLKIEEGVMEGEVMFHEIVKKTDEEVKELKNRQHKKRREKEQRKMLQELNKRKKEADKLKQKEKSLEGMKKSAGKEKGAESDGNNLNESKVVLKRKLESYDNKPSKIGKFRGKEKLSGRSAAFKKKPLDLKKKTSDKRPRPSFPTKAKFSNSKMNKMSQNKGRR